jgi:hypothetical protein
VSTVRAWWLATALCLLAGAAWAHNLSEGNASFVGAVLGPAPGPFTYLGAKHMVTGIDHVLFLTGVVFLLRRLRDVVLFVSLFTLGHSLTLIGGVLAGLRPDPFLVDAVIGGSVAYKAFDNLGGFQALVGFTPDARWAVLGFGLVHGLGLATRLQSLTPGEDGLVVNLLCFNVGVEIGQLVALAAVLGLLGMWRGRPAFARQAFAANVLLMAAGFLLVGHQLTGYLLGAAP